MIDPGQLKTRLVVQQPVETPDGQGGVTRTWTTFATVWAQVTPLAARREMQADADGATQAYRIVLRSNLSLTLQHRFSDGARVYRIVAIRDRDDRRFIEIDAEVRVS
ncbi:MAG: head-tail adaptor protein [Afipia sp. 62-7]|nr:phage head closure protein [Afipia sp.]OJU14927.1 MAG: head-tail adaptor protein [Afipia sp. 62-7]